MKPLPQNVTDEQILRFVDGRAALLEAEDYQAAYDYTNHDPGMGWTPNLMRQAVKEYGAAAPDQRVTVAEVPTDVKQRKEVRRWPVNDNGSVGDVWYDLNISGEVSDLTATFYLINSGGGVIVELDDIHVM